MQFLRELAGLVRGSDSLVRSGSKERWRADLQAGGRRLTRPEVSFATKSPEELGSVFTLLCLVILSRAMLQRVRISPILSLSNIPYVCLAHTSQNLVANLLFLSILLDIHPDVVNIWQLIYFLRTMIEFFIVTVLFIS